MTRVIKKSGPSDAVSKKRRTGNADSPEDENYDGHNDRNDDDEIVSETVDPAATVSHSVLVKLLGGATCGPDDLSSDINGRDDDTPYEDSVLDAVKKEMTISFTAKIVS